MTWIQTFKGHKFNLHGPDPKLIDPEELATVLSRICRFGGHCAKFYSVAQHSVLVCDLLERPRCEIEHHTPCRDRGDYICPACKQYESLKLPALLHDAHEAYWGFGDVCRPAKQLTPEVHRQLKKHATSMDKAIATRFGFYAALFKHDSVTYADNKALATEARDLMEAPPCPWEALPPPDKSKIKPWTMKFARDMFLRRLNELM